MPIVAIPPELLEKLGPEASARLAVLLNDVTAAQQQTILALVEDRFARRLTESEVRLRQHGDEVRVGLEQKIVELGERVTHLEAKLEVKIADSHANLVKWLFLFWLGQFALLVPLFVKLYG